MSGGHEAVKSALATHLATHLPAWMAGVQDAGWPETPKFIAITDIPPESDKHWPWLIISSTAMVRSLFPSAIAGTQFVGDYDVKVTVGVRALKERDVESAIFGRDRLMLAVRHLLLSKPDLSGDGSTIVLASSLTEITDAAANDVKTRPVALGETSFQVRHYETIPDPDAVVSDKAVITIGTTDAAGSI